MYRKHNEDCAHCRWCDFDPEVEASAVPTCRRHAPLVTGGMMSAVETVWPKVDLNAVCGDFQPEPIEF